VAGVARQIRRDTIKAHIELGSCTIPNVGNVLTLWTRTAAFGRSDYGPAYVDNEGRVPSRYEKNERPLPRRSAVD
jgi:hypothetical protein